MYLMSDFYMFSFHLKCSLKILANWMETLLTKYKHFKEGFHWLVNIIDNSEAKLRFASVCKNYILAYTVTE